MMCQHKIYVDSLYFAKPENYLNLTYNNAIIKLSAMKLDRIPCFSMKYLPFHRSVNKQDD